MWISGVKLNNVRCFREETVELSRGINVLVGENNSGKSTVLHALRIMQYSDALKLNDKRIGAQSVYVQISIEDNKDEYFPKAKGITHNLQSKNLVGIIENKADRGFEFIKQDEPENFIYPYLSKRKVARYKLDVGSQFDRPVTGDYSNLYAKIDRISNPSLPAHEEYVRACNRILGFTVMTSSATVGKHACYTVSNNDNITVDAMGEGIPSILGLIVDLCYAKPNRLFLIEEPENDIHPKALKELMELIIEKSESHQFVITTHSNIVVRYLASIDGSKIFEVNTRIGEDKLFTSEIEEIKKDAEARRIVLERLGYEPVDFEKWDGWLFLEEASAEKIIRDHLMRWFVPRMEKRIKTYSTRSVSEVKKKFDEFNRLFAFLNMEPVYRNKAWVIIDGGEDEERAQIYKLKETYVRHGWNEGQFMQFDEHDFERYYPKEFGERVEAILKENRETKRKEKPILLADVESWIKEDDERAKSAFENSAAEVISKLRTIESELGLKS